MKRMKPLSRAYMLAVYAFLYAPIAVLIFFSFNESKSRSNFTGFTLQWYEKLFQNELILSSLLNTLIVSFAAAILATILGTAAAIGLGGMRRWARGLVLNITYLPIINPEIVTGVSLMLLFVFVRQMTGQLSMGFATLILAHISFNVPYVILSVMPKLRQMDRNLYNAALDLGCSPVQGFFKVVIPEIMPGIVSGFLMSLTYSLDDFIISYFTSGANSQTLSITIYSMTRKKVSPEINAISTIIFVVVLMILIAYNVADARIAARKTRGRKGSLER